MNKSQFSISTKVECGKVVITDCAVGTIKDGEFLGYRARAIWDTGASRSAISERIASKLNLNYLGSHRVGLAHGNDVSLPVYSGASFMFSEDLTCCAPAVDVVDLSEQDFDAIIGMDIIGHGCLTMRPSKDGTTTRFKFTYTEE